MTRLVAILSAVIVAGCGGDPLLVATFTSRIVQLDTCRTVGEGSEGCVRREEIAERRLDLVEVEPGLFWLYGLPRDGVTDRAILGSRDSEGGFLFVDERTQTNSVTGCELVTRVSVNVLIDPERVADAGLDPCVALVGRSVETVVASPACDSNVPAQQVVQTVRRRFEPVGVDSTCGAAEEAE
jgi:hypothetical protein